MFTTKYIFQDTKFSLGDNSVSNINLLKLRLKQQQIVISAQIVFNEMILFFFHIHCLRHEITIHTTQTFHSMGYSLCVVMSDKNGRQGRNPLDGVVQCNLEIILLSVQRKEQLKFEVAFQKENFSWTATTIFPKDQHQMM